MLRRLFQQCDQAVKMDSGAVPDRGLLKRSLPSKFLLTLCVFAAVANGAREKATRGLVLHEPGAFAGYTLFAPLHSSTAYLVDMEGREVHEWRGALTPGSSVYLKENGNLLRCLRLPSAGIFRGAGTGGRIHPPA